MLATLSMSPSLWDKERPYHIFGARGGDFTTADQKAQTEWAMMQKRLEDMPGPGEYTPRILEANTFRGKFSTGHPKSELDWIALRQPHLPGPGAYRVETAKLGKCIGATPSRTTTIATGKLPSDLDRVVQRSKQVPGPGTYSPDTLTIGSRTRPRYPVWTPPVSSPDTELSILQEKIERLRKIQECQTPDPSLRSPYEKVTDHQLVKLKKKVHARLSMSLDETGRSRRGGGAKGSLPGIRLQAAQLHRQRNVALSLQAYLNGPPRRQPGWTRGGDEEQAEDESPYLPELQQRLRNRMHDSDDLLVASAVIEHAARGIHNALKKIYRMNQTLFPNASPDNSMIASDGAQEDSVDRDSAARGQDGTHDGFAAHFPERPTTVNSGFSDQARSLPMDANTDSDGP